jgi:hypothetical protein
VQRTGKTESKHKDRDGGLNECKSCAGHFHFHITHEVCGCIRFLVKVKQHSLFQHVLAVADVEGIIMTIEVVD